MLLELINKRYSFSYTSAAIIVALSHPIGTTNPLFIKNSDYTTTANSNESYEDILLTRASKSGLLSLVAAKLKGRELFPEKNAEAKNYLKKANTSAS